MFAIYNIEGRRFRDTLENLHKVRETQASPGMQLRSNVSEDETQPIPGNIVSRSDILRAVIDDPPLIMWS